ncbi:MAG: CRISPR-associated helicase Cas3' [Clostridiaceae bacterium]|jgi:CRISPR-associated endonuclease/helicase Cas3|nr:CRISPR-associated helicase Cas3' [Clostridiaceae bacterium]
MGRNKYIAHIRNRDKAEQSLEDHLKGVAYLARVYADKIGFGDFGELIGLIHDVGKYSESFQNYICSNEGVLDQDNDSANTPFHKSPERKIDHSTSGAQILWREMSGSNDPVREISAQILALTTASHHSGLRDCIAPDGKDVFSNRMNKADNLTHLDEIVSKLPENIKESIYNLANSVDNINKLKYKLHSIIKRERSIDFNNSRGRSLFKIGLLMKIIYSCLIDADRTDTINFENIHAKNNRQNGSYVNWEILINRLESHIANFNNSGVINRTRKIISDNCKDAANRPKGIFTLTVPTGGGKTLSSLRFALHHALKCEKAAQKIDRIFYIIPYTTIIDQNAKVARDILEPSEDRDKIILECHSNLTDENETWRGKLLSENWDAPIVFTTSVQFLETLFGGGTRNIRRLHQLVNSIIIFDEIQTIPIRTVHMFCNAVNFLVEECGASIVLCTATQPLLNGKGGNNNFKTLGALSYTDKDEIMQNTKVLFKDLHRVDVIDQTKDGGYLSQEIAEMAINEQKNAGSCLVIANTTKVAREIYLNVQKCYGGEVVHLSANMCPAHRTKILEKIREYLNPSQQKQLICISTQVIEAGVDVDFGSVIRCLAGLDSVAQAAGRCNRNGLRPTGRVLLVNPSNENIDKLIDIKEGRDICLRVLRDLKNRSDYVGEDLLSPETISHYFDLYFYRRGNEMTYKVNKYREDTLLEMLSENKKAVHEYLIKNNSNNSLIPLCQSFGSASEEFKAIEAPTRGILVPYSQGIEIISALCGEFDSITTARLLHKAQRYSVNVYQNVFNSLLKNGALYEIGSQNNSQGIGVWALREEYYSLEFGISPEKVRKIDTEVV